jgi:uncharacterized delta-60 repeat protein
MSGFRRRLAAMLAMASLLIVITPGSVLAAPSDLDPTFSGDGIASATVGGNSGVPLHFAFQGDGKIVAGTNCVGATAFDFCLARLNTDGSLDTSFSGDGTVLTDISGDFDEIWSVGVQSDGKILAGGTCGPNFYSYFCLARYDTSGNLDTTFSGDGMLMTDVAQSSGTGNGSTGGSKARSLLIQPDGKILLVGTCGYMNQSYTVLRDACAARYNADGTLDATFGSGGRALHDLGTNNDSVNAAALESDGAIILGGSCGNTSSGSFCIARFSGGGTYDSSMGTITTAMGLTSSVINDVAITSSGAIAAVGSCVNPGTSESAFCIARYTAGGALDTTFNGTGKQLIKIGSGGNAQALALQASGKLIVAGGCLVNTNPANQDFCLARYTVDGTLDPTFGTGGIATTDITSSDYVGDIEVAGNGKIVVGGWCPTDWCFARYIGDPFDVDPPAITLSIDAVDSQAASGWYNAATSGSDGVLIHMSATDATAVLSVTCSDNGTQVFSTKNATGTFVLGDGMHSISCVGDDGVNPPGAGTGSTPMPFLVNVDKTAPTATCVVNPVVLHSAPASVVVANVTDATSGPSSSTWSAPNPDTSTIGLHSVVISPTDNAGNIGSATCSYRVAYVFTGYAAPISSSSFSYVTAVTGKVIPFRFTLTDANGQLQSGLASVVAAEVAGTCSGTNRTLAATEYLKSGKTGLVALGTGSYEYDWKAAKKDGGLCRLVNLTLADGTTHGATILFGP